MSGTDLGQVVSYAVERARRDSVSSRSRCEQCGGEVRAPFYSFDNSSRAIKATQLCAECALAQVQPRGVKLKAPRARLADDSPGPLGWLQSI